MQPTDTARQARRAVVPSRWSAGSPPVGLILAEESGRGRLPAARGNWSGDGELFVLKVVGDSMIEAAICDGDWVTVRRQPVAENGDIVAAMLDGEATVKRFKREDGPCLAPPAQLRLRADPGRRRDHPRQGGGRTAARLSAAAASAAAPRSARLGPGPLRRFRGPALSGSVPLQRRRPDRSARPALRRPPSDAAPAPLASVALAAASIAASDLRT